MTSEQDVKILKHELIELFEHIQIIRAEIAAIRKPGADEDHFLQMSDELDAIVVATEEATNQIMENVEEIEELVDTARGLAGPGEASDALSKISDKTSNVFQACSFQDITGQRITKVVKLLKYVEERVNALIAVWGEDEIAKAEVDQGNAAANDPYKRYLHGPQLAGEGVSQDDVDAMLAGGAAPDIEKKAHVAPKPSQLGVKETAPPPAPEEKGDAPKLDQSDIDSLFD